VSISLSQKALAWGRSTCAPQIFGLSLCGLFLQLIFVMQPAKNGRRADAITGGQPVSVWTQRSLGFGRFRNSGSHRGVRAVRMVKGEKLAELLEGPVGGPMRRDVGVQNPARLNFHRDEYIQNPESRSDRYEEITGNQTFCVVAYECGPSQAG
jgi:hypothetical protein